MGKGRHRLPNHARYFGLLHGVVRRRLIGRQRVRRRRFPGFARIQGDGGMTVFPAKMVAAEIGQRGEKPRGDTGIWAEPCALLIQPHERLGGEIARLGGVLDVAESETEERLLPTRNEPIESGVVARSQSLKKSEIDGGVGRHGGINASAGSRGRSWWQRGHGRLNQVEITPTLPGIHHVGGGQHQALGQGLAGLVDRALIFDELREFDEIDSAVGAARVFEGGELPLHPRHFLGERPQLGIPGFMKLLDPGKLGGGQMKVRAHPGELAVEVIAGAGPVEIEIGNMSRDAGGDPEQEGQPSASHR